MRYTDHIRIPQPATDRSVGRRVNVNVSLGAEIEGHQH